MRPVHLPRQSHQAEPEACGVEHAGGGAGHRPARDCARYGRLTSEPRPGLAGMRRARRRHAGAGGWRRGGVRPATAVQVGGDMPGLRCGIAASAAHEKGNFERAAAQGVQIRVEVGEDRNEPLAGHMPGLRRDPASRPAIGRGALPQHPGVDRGLVIWSLGGAVRKSRYCRAQPEHKANRASRGAPCRGQRERCPDPARESDGGDNHPFAIRPFFGVRHFRLSSQRRQQMRATHIVAKKITSFGSGSIIATRLRRAYPARRPIRACGAPPRPCSGCRPRKAPTPV